MKNTLTVGAKKYHFYDLNQVGTPQERSRLPMVLKVLLENLLRFSHTPFVQSDDIQAILSHAGASPQFKEIAFMPARVLLQDFTGVPAIVDLAAMRDAMKRLGGDASKINPLSPAELVIDHSVQVDFFGNKNAFSQNARIEFERNQERYAFLKWGQKAFENFKVVPPDMGIVHQVNLEYLARVVFLQEHGGEAWLYPDTVVGTDSHTTMVNGLGVLGWGVGGIEAEAALLGQPQTMLIPEVVGFELLGRLPAGSTATDLVLTVTQILRKAGVVGKFVEFYGEGLKNLPLADRATIANMAPEYGATCGYFPVDQETLTYLRLTGRSEEQISLIEAYTRAQGLFWTPDYAAQYTRSLQLDMSSVEPCLAGPKRPQDKVLLKNAGADFEKNLKESLGQLQKPRPQPTATSSGVKDGAVVIAAITSCTNTSNPAVLVGAGLLAQKALEKGLNRKPWVKTSLAPGSRVVTTYLQSAGLSAPLADLGFHLVGYGCTTCIGNSGPLPAAVSDEIKAGDYYVAAVLSGNRNFEGRIHPEVRMNYLASPLLVVAYAIAGTLLFDWDKDPLGQDPQGRDVFLRDIWPSPQEIQRVLSEHVKGEFYRRNYETVFDGDESWKTLSVPTGTHYDWDHQSTYVKNPPYFDNMSLKVPAAHAIQGARVLVMLGDSVTTDHISPAGSIKVDSPAGQYLLSHGVSKADFNSYGARRGNHEVMVRGTFANIRLKNQLVPGTEGGVTCHFGTGETVYIFEASERYQKENTPLIVLAGQEYGSGSSRDWAAKGPKLLGIQAVIAESYERIHRSNLIGMGILPLQYASGQTAKSLKLTGHEIFDFEGLDVAYPKKVKVKAKKPEGAVVTFEVDVRLDTPQEVEYYRHGGILQYVLRQFFKK